MTVLNCTIALILNAYIIRIFDMNYFREQGDIEYNGLFVPFYGAVYTMTTVGYGDIYPCTYQAKVISSITCFLGLYMMRIFADEVCFMLEPEKNEQQVAI